MKKWVAFSDDRRTCAFSDTLEGAIRKAKAKGVHDPVATMSCANITWPKLRARAKKGLCGMVSQYQGENLN